MRVALVCPYSWSVPGGVQSHVSGLARELRRRGHDVDVLAPADGPAPGVVGLGRSVPIPDNGSVQRVALSPAAAARTIRVLRRARYDVVHLHEPMLPAPCLTALALRPAPLVGTFHMAAEARRWYRVFGTLCRRALARLDVRIAVSEAARRYVAASCPGEYAVVPNGVARPRTAARAGAPDAPPRILFVGRPEPRKGLPVLLEAFASVDGGARLDLVGPDGDFGERVTAHGRVDDARRAELLRGASVLCAPSLRAESFGLVLVEAMAAGVPVVASDLPAYRAVLPENCGELVPPGDPPALALALERLLADRDLRAHMAAAGPAEAARYDWERVAGRILELYEQAIHRSCLRASPANSFRRAA
ncbi:MAG TPA: glycosyltransferase family 4 protein [Gaiellaceae bacterium]|nr:glycosyltransferase family 4 protein [Gaiellaceae bacterium]